MPISSDLSPQAANTADTSTGTLLSTEGLASGNDLVQVAAADGHFILIDGFPIDLALSENHVYESEVSEYPVEDGSDVTDNIRPKPITVTLEGLVSDSPLQQVRNTRVNKGLGPNAGVLPSTEAYLRLLKIREKREPVTIVTSLNWFESMALKSLSIPRASGEPHALKFHATFVQIEIVTTNRAQRVAVPRAASNENAGLEGLKWRRPGGIMTETDYAISQYAKRLGENSLAQQVRDGLPQVLSTNAFTVAQNPDALGVVSPGVAALRDLLGGD